MITTCHSHIIQIEVAFDEKKYHVIPPHPLPFVYRDDDHGYNKILMEKSSSTDLVHKVINVEESMNNGVEYLEFVNKQAQVAKEKNVAFTL